MGIVESDIQKQIAKLSKQLESAKLAQRDATLKSSRESAALKRLIITLAGEYRTESDETEQQLTALRVELENNSDLSKVMARLAIVEHVLRQDAQHYHQKKNHFDETVQQSGEFLQRFPILPRNLKQDLRALMTRPHYSSGHIVATATRLLQIYESGLKACVHKKGVPQTHPDFDTGLLKQLNQELQTLITQIDFAGDAGEMLADIRAKLMLGCSGEELLRVTLSVLKLVLDGTDYERRTSETFLTQVNESLTSIETSTKNSLEQARTSATQSEELNQELQDTIGKAKKLTISLEDGAKKVMTPTVQQLANLADRFVQSSQREQHLIEQLQFAESQLAALSDVTQDYRRRLDDQQQRAKKDPLTQLYNHSAIIDIVAVEYQKWIRSQSSIHLALLDINRFKEINDSFGFTAGDKALTIIARTVKDEVGHIGEVGRFTGEKFLILIRNQNHKQCRTILESIRTSIAALPFRFKTQDIRISASIACTQFHESHSSEESIERLAQEISAIKKQGSNDIHWL
jgi:diguanylate cyclase (GGDEF)-like protein